jgi:trimeric autotransporter adhesin
MVAMKHFKHFLSTLTLALALHAGTAWGANWCSPIVIDLGNNGINLGQAGVGVYFDVNADGVRDHVQWVRRGGDEGFLALDRSGNGLVDDGSELFGVGTPLLPEGSSAPNGFVGLAQYDSRQLGGNDDGIINAADAIWPQLRIWVDANADGVSTYEEMRTLRSFGLTALETIPKIRKYRDAAGNIIPYWAWASQRERPGRALMVDVYFLVLP